VRGRLQVRRSFAAQDDPASPIARRLQVAATSRLPDVSARGDVAVVVVNPDGDEHAHTCLRHGGRLILVAMP
jgi:hypothetical protein